MATNKSGFFTRLFRFFNILLVLLTGVALIAPNFTPDTFWPFIFVGMGFPILVLLNIICVCFWLFRRKWYFLFSLVAIIVSWGAISRFVGNPFKMNQYSLKGKEIQVVTFNAGGGLLVGAEKVEDLHYIVNYIAPDILLLQELIVKGDKLNFMDKFYPYSIRKGVRVIYSKYPVVKQMTMDVVMKGSYNGADWFDLRLDEENTIRVYNTHLNTNRITGRVAKLSKGNKLKKLEHKETLAQAKGILNLVKKTAGIRSKQAEQIHDSIQASPYPVIVCGDFNDPPQSYTYQTIKKGLKDAFVEGGKGVGFTYKGKLPFLKIDYTFVSPEIEVVSSEVLPSVVSDHKPILTTLRIPTK